VASVKPNHYVLSDLHLGHSKIISFARKEFDTIEEHDSHIIKTINNTCDKNDVLWLLGDIAFTNKGLEMLGDIDCNLRLVGGNHDNKQLSRYLKNFKYIRGVACYGDKKAVLTHIPIHPDSMRWEYNIHGHLHRGTVRHKMPLIPFKFCPEDKRYINVCCEHLDYTPVQIKDLV